MKKMQILSCAVIFLMASELMAATWLTDFAEAQTKAKTENKMLLLNFSGSDWCGWCIRLRNEVFSKPEFEAFANENFVLVEIDFPQRKAQPANVKKANAALARKFKIEGYPTVILLDSGGGKVGQTGYLPGGPKAYIAALQKLSGNKLRQPPAAPEPPPTPPRPDPPPLPLFSGAPPGPPANFTNLYLKGITGPKSRRLAIINNVTFGEGDQAFVKIGAKPVKILCVEIRDRSVVVKIEGQNETRELPLAAGL